MTPELKMACEVVFQEHKSPNHHVTWNRNAFLGRISAGLSEMAKETLIEKNIIYFPNPAKKVNTLLNPAVWDATTVAEAENILLMQEMPETVNQVNTANHVNHTKHVNHVKQEVSIEPVVKKMVVAKAPSEPAIRKSEMTILEPEPVMASMTGTKWYMKPVFYYFLWPVCAACAGGVIAYLLGSLLIYKKELF